MVRKVKKVDFYVSIEVFRWIQENVPPGCFSAWAEDAFCQKIGFKKLVENNIKTVESKEPLLVKPKKQK